MAGGLPGQHWPNQLEETVTGRLRSCIRAINHFGVHADACTEVAARPISRPYARGRGRTSTDQTYRWIAAPRPALIREWGPRLMPALEMIGCFTLWQCLIQEQAVESVWTGDCHAPQSACHLVASARKMLTPACVFHRAARWDDGGKPPPQVTLVN